MKKARTLLILPCTNHKPYTESLTWKYVINKLDGRSDKVELAAIDCITNPETGKPFGLVMKREQSRTLGLDEFPDMAKVHILQTIVERQLRRKRIHYDRIVAYVNVKSYWNVLWQLRDKYSITMLPRLFRKRENWNSAIAGISPRGAFYRDIDELLRFID